MIWGGKGYGKQRIKRISYRICRWYTGECYYSESKKRKVYIPEEIFMVKDAKIGKPVLCIEIAEEREMEEDEIKAAEEDERGGLDES